MQKFLEGEIDAIFRPTVIFSYTNKLKITELANAETNPPQNLQDNGATRPVSTQILLLHSLLEETSVASAEPLTLPRVKARYYAL